MTEVYPGFPSLNQLSIPQRTKAFERVCLQRLQQTGDVDSLQALATDAVANEQYEFAQGLEQAVEKFSKQPQLSLF